MIKHIFYVESGVALSIARKSISQMQLEKKDCFFLLGRSIPQLTDINSFQTDTWDFRTSWFIILGWYRALKVRKELFELLQEQGINDYFLYSASISKWWIYLLRKSKNCLSFTFIEEGRTSYYTENELKNYITHFYSSLKYRIFQFKYMMNYFFIFFPNPNKALFYFKKYNEALVCSPESYKFIDNRTIIKNPFESLGTNYQNVECLMAFSYPVEDSLISLENYLVVLDETFKRLSVTDIKTIHFKFHPIQIKQNKYLEDYSLILEKYKNRFTFVELKANIVLEEVVANSNALVLSDYSSLLIYTHVFGNKILSNYNLLKKHSTSIEKRLSILPDVLLTLLNNNPI